MQNQIKKLNEWDIEPNSESFVYRGYQCRIIRHDDMGFLCGYVGLRRNHKYYETEYDDIPVDCHGGLTYSRKSLRYDPCKSTWWIGFDCGHYMDLSPYTMERGFVRENSVLVYRNMAFVREEITNIVDQLEDF